MTPLLHSRIKTRQGLDMALQGVDVRGSLRGLRFEAHVEQRFVNPSHEHVEVIYNFALPWRAVLLGVDVVLGDKRLCGSVVEKRQAEACYEEALSEGNTSVMLERSVDQSYSLNLGNLAGKEACVVTLRYAQTLRFEQRNLRLMVPTVIAPRYGDSVSDGGLQPHQASEHSLLAEYPFNLELEIGGALAVGRVASPSHPIRVAHGISDGEARLTVSLAQQARLDRDFVLVLDELGDVSATALGHDAVVPDRVVALASFCPAVPGPNPVPACAKILVDCSGSMLGDSIAAAKQALRSIVCGMQAGDRYSLSRFGDTVEHIGRGMWMATDITRTSALTWVAGLNAHMGGTKMEAALQSTFSLPCSQTSDVLLITDGEIASIDSTIQAARQSGHRLFIVGIGSSPAESHLRRLAEATGGVCEFVAPGEEVEPCVLRMFARLRSQPLLQDAEVLWPEEARPLWVSALPPSIFDGDTVNVFAMFDRAPSGTVQLTASRADGSRCALGSARFEACVENNDTLSRLAAADRIHTLKTSQDAAVVDEALRLALDYQLITDKTNFLLVHERAHAARASTMPKLLKVVQMTPAGWAGVGSVAPSDAMPSLGSGHSQAWDVDAFALSLPERRTEPASRRLSMPAMYSEPHPRWIEMTYGRMDQYPLDANRGDFWRAGWSPLELSNWLQTCPPLKWPKTIEELAQLGLPGSVQRWLTEPIPFYRLGSPTRLERVVLRMFLHVMSLKETNRALMQQADLVAPFKAHLEQIKLQPASELDVGAADQAEWVERIVKSIDEMTASSWPTALQWPAMDSSSRMATAYEARKGRVDPSKGLSPSALNRWLLLTGPAAWPATYAMLEMLGVQASFIDQLENTVGRRLIRGGSTELQVVAAFVFVMTQTETRDALFGSGNVFDALTGRLSELRKQGRAAISEFGQVDFGCVERVTFALRDMSPDSWPDEASMAVQQSWSSRAKDALSKRLKSLV